MWSFATSIFEKVLHFSPIKSILQQLFQKFSNDFLQVQPQFAFKNGVLVLEKLQLSATKINQTFLIGSPYALSYGLINSIRINLPGNQNKQSKNVQINIEGVQLVMQPNKKFKETFQQNIKQIKSQSFIPQQKVTEQKSNSMNFLKRMMQEFFSNIMIQVKGISIKWFLNSPSNQPILKPQHYIMFKIPRVLLERVNDMEVGKISEDFVKYRIQIPLISTHLLKEDLKIPSSLSNTFCKLLLAEDYSYVNHPSTIFLVGKCSQSRKERIVGMFRISRDIKNKTKQLLINFEIPNMQFMIQPKQMIVIHKYFEQIQTFKMVYKSIIQRFKAQSTSFDDRPIEESRDFDVPHQFQYQKSPTRCLQDPNKSMDIFSSFAMSLENLAPRAPKQSSYLLNVFENNKEIDIQIQKLQKQMKIEEKIAIQQQVGDFKSITNLRLSVELIRVYLMKYESSSEFIEYQRFWFLDNRNQGKLINKSIPTSYIMLSANVLSIQYDSSSSTSILLRDLSILDVNLKNQVIESQKKVSSNLKQSQILNVNQSIDMYKSFQSLPHEQQGFKQLLKYQRNPLHTHYCSTKIFSISNNHQQDKKIENHPDKYHNFCLLFNKINQLPEKDYGFIIKIENHEKKKINISLYSVQIFIDYSFLHDLVMMYRPLLAYKDFSIKNGNFFTPETELPIKKIKILNHSVYDFNDQIGNNYKNQRQRRSSTFQHKKNIKPQVNLEIQQFYGILEPLAQNHINLVDQYKSHKYDNQLFHGQCYCNKKIDGIDIIAKKISLKKCLNLKIATSEVSARKVSHKNKINIEDILGIGKQGKNLPRLCIETICTETIIKKQVMTVSIPKLGIIINKQMPKILLSFAENLKQSVDQLQKLNKYLKEEVDKFSQRQLLHGSKIPPKVNKLAKVLNINVERLGFHFLNYEVLLKNIVCKIQQSILIVKIFEGVLVKTNQPKLKLQNPWKIGEFAYFSQQEHGKQFSNYGIKAGIDRIVAYIRSTQSIPAQGQLKDKQYFQTIFKLYGPVEINFSIQKTKHKNHEQKLPKSPNFNKPHKNQFNSQTKVLDIILRVPIVFKACELRQFKNVKIYIDDLKNMIKQSPILSFNNKRRLSQDANSQQIPLDTLQEKLILKITAQKIYLDVFPYVQSNKSEQVLSHTRSMMEIYDLEINFNQKQTIQKKKKIEKLKIKWKQICLYFLAFSDCHLQLNRQIIPFQEIESYGFKRMLDIKGELEFSQTQTQKFGKQRQLTANIFDFDSTFSSHTIGFMDDHIKHVIKTFESVQSSIKSNASSQKKQRQEFQSDESSAEDLDEIQLKMRQQNELRIREQSDFRSDPIQLLQRQKSQNLILRLSLKQIDVKRLCIKITDKPEYQFFNYIPRGQEAPLMMELDQKLQVSQDLFIQKHEINKFKRFRTMEKKDGKLIRILLQNSMVFMDKYENRLNLSELNLSLVANIKALQCSLYTPDQDPFYILRTVDRLQFIVDFQQKQVKIKTSIKRLQLGFTSGINFIKNDISKYCEKRKQSVFVQQQQPALVISNSKPYDVMLFIPEMSIILNLKLIGLQFINNQSLNIPSFFFHNVMSNYMQSDNKQELKQWIKNILTDNLGGLLGNGFTSIMSNSLIGLLGCLKQILMLPGQAFKILTS